MSEPVIRFPIQCPVCARETLTQFSVSTIASSLITGDSIPLIADCHSVRWDATPDETEQIREYLAAGGPFVS
jgi:hypothetical protein